MREDSPPGISPASEDPGGGARDLYRITRSFDFNERPLGNYEDTPMHWVRLSGPGLPNYARGRFDDEVGHAAPPSFRLNVAGGNVAYEYRSPELTVVPHADYLIRGYVRAENIQHARAFLAASVVDRFGETIPGSVRVSNLVRSIPDDPQGWQPVELVVSGDYAGAHSLRLQVWVLQTYVFRDPDPRQVDPIIRRDVQGTVWVDDITVYRLPRASLRLGHPTGLLQAGQPESLVLQASLAFAQTLAVHVWITDADGRCVYDYRGNLSSRPAPHELADGEAPLRSAPGKASPSGPATVGSLPPPTGEKAIGPEDEPDSGEPASLRLPIPPLPPGLYRAAAELSTARHRLLRRDRTFVVLEPLSSRPRLPEEMGIQLDRLPNMPLDDLKLLISELGCGAVRVYLPMVGPSASGEEQAYYEHIATLLRELAAFRIEMTGVLLCDGASASPSAGASVFGFVTRDEHWPRRLQPVLAHFGGLLTTWQLGDEPVELAEHACWDPATLDQIRREFSRFMTIPQLVVPGSVLGDPEACARPGGYAGDITSFLLPAELPASAFCWQLERLAQFDATPHWARILLDEADRSRALPAPSTLSEADGPDLLDSTAPPDTPGLPATGPADPGEQGAHRPGEPDTPHAVLDARRAPGAAGPSLGSGSGQEAIDLARRLVLARAMGADRVYVPAPFELVAELAGTAHVDGRRGTAVWQPTASFGPLRTLFHHLGDKRPVSAMTPAPDCVAILFEGETQTCLVAWTWQDRPVPVELYLGSAPQAVDLWGRAVPVRIDRGRTAVTLTPEPLLVLNAQTQLTMLQASLRLEPTCIQPHDPQSRPVLSFRNPFARELVGELLIQAPSDWEVHPARLAVAVPPGELFSRAIQVSTPPRQIEARQKLRVHLAVQEPQVAELDMEVAVVVGLREVSVDAGARWEGDTLIVEHVLRNQSDRPVSFTAFCQARGRQRMERAFLRVPPGDIGLQRYVFPRAADLEGTLLHTGVSEIHGRRRLDQLVEVPPR